MGIVVYSSFWVMQIYIIDSRVLDLRWLCLNADIEGCSDPM